MAFFLHVFQTHACKFLLSPVWVYNQRMKTPSQIKAKEADAELHRTAEKARTDFEEARLTLEREEAAAQQNSPDIRTQSLEGRRAEHTRGQIAREFDNVSGMLRSDARTDIVPQGVMARVGVMMSAAARFLVPRKMPSLAIRTAIKGSQQASTDAALESRWANRTAMDNARRRLGALHAKGVPAPQATAKLPGRGGPEFDISEG